MKKLTQKEYDDLIRKRNRDLDRGMTVGWNYTDDPITLGEKCRVLRRRMKLTVREMADRLGVSHVTIIKRERNTGDVSELADYFRSIGERL